jgi:hypothetical protein
MRLACLTAGLFLAACGGEARTALPLTAPGDAPLLVRDFIEVCSLAMAQGTNARAEAVKRGWTEAPDADKMLAHGMIVLERESGDRQLQIVDTPYPHMRVRSCMVLQLYPSDPVDLSVIGRTAGLAGEITDMPAVDGTASRGIWSFVGPEGDVVTVNTTFTPPRIVQLNMATTRRISPPVKPKT